MQVGVECTFLVDGRIRVRRIEVEGRWQPVGQGRQWVDHLGRHVLIMLPGDQAHEIRLRPDTLTWELLPLGHSTGRTV
jgi:hypothetical protein